VLVVLQTEECIRASSGLASPGALPEMSHGCATKVGLPGMGHRGDRRNSAPVESLCGTLKSEQTLRSRYETRECERCKVLENVGAFRKCTPAATFRAGPPIPRLFSRSPPLLGSLTWRPLPFWARSDSTLSHLYSAPASMVE